MEMLLGISLYLLPMLATASAKYFTNGWSVQISSNSEAEAERVAKEIKSIMKDLLEDLDILEGSHVSKWSLDLHNAALREELATDYHSVSGVQEEQSCQSPFSKEYLDELKFLLFMLLLALWAVALIVVFVNL